MVIFHSYVSLPEGRNCKFLLSKKSCWLALANSGSVTGFQISTLESAGIKNRCCALKSVMPRQRYVVVGGIVGTPGHPLATLPLRMVGGPPLTGKLLPPFGSRVACERKALHPISLWDKCNAAAAWERESEPWTLETSASGRVGRFSKKLEHVLYGITVLPNLQADQAKVFVCFCVPLVWKKSKSISHVISHCWFGIIRHWGFNQRFRWVWGTLCFIVHGTGIPKPVNVKLHIQLDGKKPGQNPGFLSSFYQLPVKVEQF